MEGTNFKINDDELIRFSNVFTGEGGFSYVSEKTVITKEEFIACYNKWVKPNMNTKVGRKQDVNNEKCMSETEEYLIQILENLTDFNAKAIVLGGYIQEYGPLSDEAGSKVKEILSR